MNCFFVGVAAAVFLNKSEVRISRIPSQLIFPSLKVRAAPALLKLLTFNLY